MSVSQMLTMGLPKIKSLAAALNKMIILMEEALSYIYQKSEMCSHRLKILI